MRGKRRRDQPPRAAKKKAKIGIEIRQQVLPTETLSDIFDASERTDLDAWNIVSRTYIQTIRRAKPLRVVDEVTLSYDIPKKVYRTVFFFVDPSREDGSLLELRDVRSYAADHLVFFFNALRFCNIDGPLKIGSVSIDREFMNGLTRIKDDFLFKVSLLSLTSDARIPQAVEPLDALCAFPSLRALNNSTLLFLRTSPRTANDGFLRSLASRGIFEIGCVTGLPGKLNNGLPGKDVTEAGVLDFCFGDYGDDDGERLLHITDAQLTPQFIPNLVEACRASKSNHKLTLKVAMTPRADAEEMAVDGMEDVGEDGLKWELSVADMGLHILFYPRGTMYGAWGLIRCVRNRNRHAYPLL